MIDIFIESFGNILEEVNDVKLEIKRLPEADS